MPITVITADYNNPQHACALIALLDSYAIDPMGGGEPLSQYAKAHLIDELRLFPGAVTLLAYHGDTPVGLANCFMGFSTFACRKLINVHDLAVLPKYRGQGISQRLLRAVEDIARRESCCKITLEVLSNNIAARAAYAKFGFSDYQLNDAAGGALFWQKTLLP